MGLALGSSAEVSSAAHVPEGMVVSLSGGTLGADAATLLRLEGFPPSIAYRLNLLQDMLVNAGELQILNGEKSKAVWRDIRDCIPFADGTHKPVWRVSMQPSEAHRMALDLRRDIPASVFYDWQGGLVWLRMEHGEPEGERLRALVKRHGGGHATLVRANAAVRAAVPVFEPQPPALRALSERLKASFDPHDILNPGRMAG